MAIDHLPKASDLVVGSSGKKPRRPRKPTLTAALKQAGRAGAIVSGATMAADGSVQLTFGEPDAVKANGNDINAWDEVLTDATHQKRPS
jgi:hypothetical protein